MTSQISYTNDLTDPGPATSTAVAQTACNPISPNSMIDPQRVCWMVMSGTTAVGSPIVAPPAPDEPVARCRAGERSGGHRGDPLWSRQGETPTRLPGTPWIIVSDRAVWARHVRDDGFP